MRIWFSRGIHKDFAVSVDWRTEIGVVNGADARDAIEQTAALCANAIEEWLLAEHLAPSDVCTQV